MDRGLTSAIAANRFGLGARPGELAAVGGSGPDRLRAQLGGPTPTIRDEGLRPHVLGNFTDMLLVTERHPAMPLYLDNQMSMGPDLRAARNIARRNPGRKTGINENLARETMELHTLSVDGGYTQTDVTAFSEVLTGW